MLVPELLHNGLVKRYEAYFCVENKRADIELHTGQYAETAGSARSRELDRLAKAAEVTARCDIECHAGHGLKFDNVEDVAALPEVAELNIGHFLVGEAIFVGLEASVSKMKKLIIAGSRRPKR